MAPSEPRVPWPSSRESATDAANFNYWRSSFYWVNGGMKSAEGKCHAHSDKRHFTVRSQRKENLRSHQRWKEWRHRSPGPLGPPAGESATALARAARQHGCPPLRPPSSQPSELGPPLAGRIVRVSMLSESQGVIGAMIRCPGGADVCDSHSSLPRTSMQRYVWDVE